MTGEYLGLDPYAADMMSWGIFEAVLTPGDLILLLSWKDEATALKYGSAIVELHKDARTRRVRIVRDYPPEAPCKPSELSPMQSLMRTRFPARFKI